MVQGTQPLLPLAADFGSIHAFCRHAESKSHGGFHPDLKENLGGQAGGEVRVPVGSLEKAMCEAVREQLKLQW